MSSETAVFGGGCFWCLEAVFSRLKGVEDVEPGYSAGKEPDPVYEQVSTGRTGHAEVVRIEFDPEEISYRQLLEVFFYIHDPTTPNRQGNDVGPQYRSIILTASPKQEKEARDYIEVLQKEKAFNNPIVTEITSLNRFYPAESYHQKYFEQNRFQPYCQVVIQPKMEKFSQKFKDILK